MKTLPLLTAAIALAAATPSFAQTGAAGTARVNSGRSSVDAQADTASTRPAKTANGKADTATDMARGTTSRTKGLANGAVDSKGNALTNANPKASAGADSNAAATAGAAR